MTTENVQIYTDGACRGNPGVGGWGATLSYNGKLKEIYGGEPATTNNRMEMMAVIKALGALTKASEVTLHSDSKYVLQGINDWMPNWKKKNWQTAAKKPVKNVDLWKQIDQLMQGHNIDWVWVKGHSGNPGNERADELANLGIDKL
ncbi:MAG: ribonuclease HI [Cycloclasticus sp.]|nr:ribonuclease HI [Cycloclasticus sp. 46_83_sub15_T18]OUR81792.1 ribonuclease HI [Cycloclasticus sp. 46_120_T64]